MTTDSEALLQDLLSVSPRSLMEVSTDGKRLLSSFCGRICTLGGHQGSESLAKQLFSLFDFLLENSFALYIIDYVNEVCRDPRCSSSNPVEAYVLEGSAVLDWCEGVLLSIKKAISRSFGSLKQETVICKQTTRAEGIEVILEALQGTVVYRDKVANALAEAEEINKSLHVVLWCMSRDFMNLEPKGPHNSYKEWKAAHGSSSQLRELCSSEMIARLGLSLDDYPYASAECALQNVFFDARLPLEKDAWRAKSMLFGYFLLQAGFLSDLERFRHHPFGLSVAEVALTEGYVSFDQYQMHGSNEMLNKGLERFRLSMPAVPFSLVDTLVGLGFSETALHIWEGQRSLRKKADVLQIQTIVKARLQREESAFALDEMRQHYQRLSGEERSHAIEVLMMEFLDWGTLFDRMDKVLVLPLNREEEDAFILWAKSNWEDDLCSVCVPMYYLARSRQLEAIKVIALAEKEGTIERSTGKVRDAWVRVQRAVHDSWQNLPPFMKEEIATIEPGTFGDPMKRDESSLLIARPDRFAAPADVVGLSIGRSEEESRKRKHSTAFGLGTLKRMR
ncbi:hypothetical protein BSKO_03245 [Bryopsis sp. KO-2023]|nr:hypothetical protein BSKO_03245 [Bryopsis sp. KO-2023]